VISQFKELVRTLFLLSLKKFHKSNFIKINFENDSLNFINEIENLIKSNKNIKNDQKLNESLKVRNI
jgi:hypothetical protein